MATLAAEAIPSSLWLRGQSREIEVDRGGQLPNGRKRRGAIVQGQRTRRIVQTAGPWRSVEQRTAEPETRDAYHVVLTDGSACWIVHELTGDRWQLVGTFD